MKSKILSSIIIASLTTQISGCSTLSTSSAAKEKANEITQTSVSLSKLVSTASTEDQVEKYYGEALSNCAAAMHGIDRAARNIGLWQTGIAIAGSLFGVTGAACAAAGTHAKSAVATMSALSGVANSTQSSIQTYLTDAQDEKQTAETFRTTMTTLIAQYSAVKPADASLAAANAALIEKRAIIARMNGQCSFYAQGKAQST